MRRKQPADEPQVQMATRIPTSLLHAVKVFCVEREVAVVEFVADAVREKLRRAGIRARVESFRGRERARSST